ncbi:MAG: DamX-like protein [Glaciecola sp.]
MSELHNRLSHLVNYSSQLIFVSGDSVSDHQRTLNEFLSQQQENTEISFFSANENKNESEYRGVICRQLGGHTVGSFVRPLNQLLIDLVADNGPYLVCITQADLLSDTFLQELWDWVMHAQQYNRKLHLNIILFGKSQWAQSSQEWLPSQNSHKPVLLSSELVDAVGFDVNALEALMANDNQYFAKQSGPLVSNKWFIGSVMGIFFVVFLGMISWQYPQHISALLAGELPPEVDTPAFDINETNIDKTPLVSEQSPAVNAEYKQNVEVISSTSVTESLLVSNWQDTDKKRETEEQQANASTLVVKEDNSVADDALELTKNAKNEPASSNDVTIPVSADELDFQVPDIISVEQLDAKLSVADSQPLSLLANTNNERDNTQPVKQITEQNVQQNDLQPAYKFDETTLLSLPTDSIVLQLSGIQNPAVLETYLNSNNLKANTWVYETQRYGGPWYVVVYKQSFNSIDAALGQLPSLPSSVLSSEPFAKSIDQIQQEIRGR